MQNRVCWLGGFGVLLLSLGGLSGCAASKDAPSLAALSDDQLEDLVRRSSQYVAMYNVNNKFAMGQGGWNTVKADTELKDHTLTKIARPNNDTLYITCLLDLRAEPMILDFPAFDSRYVSLMITAYDHYVNVPMASRNGDFQQPGKMMLYSSRTEGYGGEAVEGVDRVFESTGDFVSAIFRVMPHASDAQRFARIREQMSQIRAISLSEFRGEEAKRLPAVEFPEVGQSDADVFANNLLEVMQFVFNHTTFDPSDSIDAAVLAAYEPLGVRPGHEFDPQHVPTFDAPRIRAIVERIAAAELARTRDPSFREKSLFGLFQPKGQMTLESLVFQSVVGPIGLPAVEAVYPGISTADDEPMNALHDYVIRMPPDSMPPAGAFWSVTLYETQHGFFIANEQKKYSVGENAGMKLDPDGGISIYIAAEQPDGVPAENWLPIDRKDLGIGPIMRIYVPDLQAMKSWQPPVAARVAM